MAVEDWLAKAKEAPSTPRSAKKFIRMDDERAGALELVESLARRLDDRLAYHEERRGDSDRILINAVGLKELRHLLFVLLAQVTHWREEYKQKYEASEKKYRKLVKFLATSKTLLSEEQVENILFKLESHTYRKESK
jgi:hypothetical protein